MAKNGNYFSRTIGGKNVYEHRIVAGQILGRPLTDEEVVHHVNGNGFDNSPENLWVFRTNSDHIKFHRTGNAVKMEDGTYIAESRKPENVCICGKLCYNKYCSHECAGLGSRKLERPPSDEVWKLLETMSFVAVGKHYGVTDNAVRKWLGLKK